MSLRIAAFPALLLLLLPLLLSLVHTMLSLRVVAFSPLGIGTIARRPLPLRRSSTTTTLSASSNNVRRIGIFGGGTVGGGIVDILQSKAEYLRAMTQGTTTLEIVKICVRDTNKARDFTVPDNCVITSQYDDILNDESIDMVVEVMGGTTDAKDIIYQSLRAGKDVVTANKAMISAYLPEIETILEQVNHERPEGHKVEFRYEAAVCGGIPIIRSLQTDFVGDEIQMISGIINGCTNFMLTSMDKGGKSYDDALAEASALHLAVANFTE